MRKLIILLVALLYACCEDHDPAYQFCDVLKQPRTIIADSLEIYIRDFFTPNDDGWWDHFHLEFGMSAAGTPYRLTDVFTDVSFTVYSNSGNIPVFISNNQEAINWYGSNISGNPLEDVVYRYELRLDDKVFERLIGVHRNPFCIDDLNCDIDPGILVEMDVSRDPIYTAGCH
jgi:hypothetical protein